MDTLLSVCVGLGLAAACGFRVFIPLLVMSIAALSGRLELAPSFQWIGTYPALTAFAVATVLEVGAYYIPWLDHFLDTVATPAAVVAGTIVTASMVTDLDPYLRWTLAVIAGGGAAALVQSTTVLTRVASTATTAGLANPLVATAELALALVTSTLSIVLPVVALLLLGVAGVGVGVTVHHRRQKKSIPPKIPHPSPL